VYICVCRSICVQNTLFSLLTIYLSIQLTDLLLLLRLVNIVKYVCIAACGSGASSSSAKTSSSSADTSSRSDANAEPVLCRVEPVRSADCDVRSNLTFLPGRCLHASAQLPQEEETEKEEKEKEEERFGVG